MKNDFSTVDWMEFYKEIPKETQMRIRKRQYQLYQTAGWRTYFRFRGERHYLDEVDYNGHSMVDICNTGYYGGFRVIGFNHAEDAIILARVNWDCEFVLNKQ